MVDIDSKRKYPELIIYTLWATLAIAFGFALFRQQWTTAFVTSITFFLTLAPFALQRRYNIHIPTGFILASVFFIYATLFLGEAGDFYERFWWWDTVLHTGSALGFGLIGFIFLLLLYRSEKVQVRPFLLSLFAFCFAVAIGALWEILEFTLDSLFGLNMQKSGLVDTMWDLIVDSIGAFVASASGYLYLKTNKTGFFSRLIEEGVQRNTS